MSLVASRSGRVLVSPETLRRLINCPKLTHLKVETRKKLTRMYEEGHTVDADNFMRKLGCLHCGALSHFLVACPELQFTTKDQRWELSDLYQGGNPKQAQKLVREWREAAQPATTAAKAAPSKAAAAAPTVKPPAAAAAPAADAKVAPRPPVAAAAARPAGPAAASAAPQRPAAQIGAQQPLAQPAKQQQQAEDAPSTVQSEGSSVVVSRSGSFLDQLAPSITRQDSTASSSQTGKPTLPSRCIASFVQSRRFGKIYSKTCYSSMFNLSLLALPQDWHLDLCSQWRIRRPPSQRQTCPSTACFPDQPRGTSAQGRLSSTRSRACRPRTASHRPQSRAASLCKISSCSSTAPEGAQQTTSTRSSPTQCLCRALPRRAPHSQCSGQAAGACSRTVGPASSQLRWRCQVSAALQAEALLPCRCPMLA